MEDLGRFKPLVCFLGLDVGDDDLGEDLDDFNDVDVLDGGGFKNLRSTLSCRFGGSWMTLVMSMFPSCRKKYRSFMIPFSIFN